MPDIPDPCDLLENVPGVGGGLTVGCDVAVNPVGGAVKAADAAAGAAGDGISDVAAGVVDSAFGKAAQAVGQAAGDLLKTAMTWWINTDSIQIDPTAIADTQRPLTGVFTLIMMVGVLSTALLMVVQRRGDSAMNLLLGAIKYVAISTLSIAVLQGALGASDEVAQSLIADGSEKFGENLAALLGIEVLTNPALVLILGLICGLLALIQWVFGFIREAGILVLAAMLGIAAAGQLSTWGRQWFPRLASSLVALVLYKPMAAMIFSIGFKYMGQGKDLATVVTGIMVVALAVIALPAMMKFFSFVGTGVGGGGSGMALAAAGAGLAARGASGGGGGGSGSPDTATSVANHMEATGPGTGVQDTPPGPGEGGRGEAPTGGPGGGGPGGGGPGGGGGGAANVDGGESSDDGGGSAPSDDTTADTTADTTGDTASSGRHSADDTSTATDVHGDGSGSAPGPVPGEDTPDDGIGAGSPVGAGAVDGGEAAAAGGGAAGGGAAAAAGPVGAAAVAGAAALDAVSGAAEGASSTMQGNDDEKDES